MTPAQKKLAELKSLVEAKHPYYSAPFTYADALKLIEALETAVSALEKTELRFTAMTQSTTEYGAPSSTELILMCNQSSTDVEQALASIESILGGG
jgi:hypothetical protein